MQRSSPEEIEAIFQLHKEQGGGWITRQAIDERVERNRAQRPRLPPILPRVTLPPILPPLKLPPILPPLLPKVPA